MTNRIGHIEEKTLTDALSERYLAYAMSTIMSRSLPDVRDGLKPVQRRLLYAMHQLHLSPDSGFKKCARVVGDVIGKFHPHGDASVYEALVRLAQDFAARYPLVEGQGNFGSVDGDGPAAMRYTESRLTLTAMLMLEGLGEETVDQRSTYDNEDSEPVVLPAFFPNLLANGASGIAVGMATNIPPHNAPELYAAGELLLRNPQTSLSEILELMPGPDFPTGGIIQESPEDIALAYGKGRGSFRIRARWETEHLKGGNWQIIVTELPYQVQKSRLIEQIARLLEEKKLPLLADVSDDSAADIRLILHPRSRSVQPEILMETLFRSTALESRFSLNMNILAGGRIPEVMSLRGAILAWLDHVHDVFIRRTSHRLQKVQRRLEILEGFIRLYLNLDETIRIIREEDDPRPVLMAHFALSEVQVEYVLNMRLRSLRKLEEVEIRREQARLLKEEKTLQKLLASEPLRRKKLGEELARLRARYEALPVGKRRTDIQPPLPPVDLTALAEIEREPLTVLLSRKGWIRTLKGHSIDPSTYRFKEGDALDRTLECQSTDRLCLCGSSGRSYTLKALDIPGGRGFGQPVRLFADLGMDEEVVNLFPLSDPNKSWLIATSHGRGMRVMEETLLSEKRGGKQIFTPSSGEKVRFFLSCGEADRVLCLGEDRRALIFLLEEVPGMMRGKGVMLQKQGKGELKTVRLFSAEEGLLWKEGQNLRKMKDLEEWQGRRGSAGKPAAQWMLRK